MSGYPKNEQQSSREGNTEGGEMLDMLKRMQQQLVYLEKKIDSLIAQRPPQGDRPPFRREGGFQRPFRPYDRPRSEGAPSGGGQGGPERPYRPGGFNKGGFKGGFNKGGFGKPRPEGSGPGGPGGFKKKPFYKRER